MDKYTIRRRYSTIINGEITSLEEDMIEISLLSSTKIYIDFAYKGSLNLPIENIREITNPTRIS